MRFLDHRPRLCLVALCLALWLPGLFVLPPTDRDESRFALATRQMVASGDFVRIMNGAVPRNKKPIGIHWLQAPFVVAAQAAGVATENPIWPYRLPSLLGALLAVLATADIGGVLLGSRRGGLIAGAMLASSVILTVEAHIAKTDAALLGATTLAMAILARAWMGCAVGRGAAALFWVALGAGILIKGPIAPMVVGLCAGAACLAERRWRWLLALRPASGALVLLLVVLPWFVAIGVASHGAFFTQAVGGDLGRKLAGGEESHGAPPGLHLLLLPLLAFPGSVPVIVGLAAAVARRREPAIRFLLAWLVPAWLVFEAVPTKLPHYTLPLYPALCLLGADACTRLLPVGNVARVARLVGQVCVAAVAAGLGGAVLIVPILLHAAWWPGLAAAVLVVPPAVLAWRARPLAAALSVVPLYAVILQFELPRLDAVWIAPRAVAALRAAWPGVPRDGAGVIAAGYAEPSLMFLVGPRLRVVPTGAMAARAWAALPHAAAFVAGPDLAGFGGVAPAATIEGFNEARGTRVSLSLFVK